MTTPSIVQTEPLTVAYLTMRGSYAQTPEGLGRLYAWIGTHGLQPTGMPTAVYLTVPAETPESEAVWELWAPVAGEAGAAEPGPAGIGIKQVASVTAATVMHKGPYDSVASSYESLGQWIAENGYSFAGPPMERYYSDPAEVPPEEYLTEILIPVRRA